MMRHFYLLFLCGFTAIGFALTDVRINARTYVGACNETANPELMVAIRFFENNEWRTKNATAIMDSRCLVGIACLKLIADKRGKHKPKCRSA